MAALTSLLSRASLPCPAQEYTFSIRIDTEHMGLSLQATSARPQTMMGSIYNRIEVIRQLSGVAQTINAEWVKRMEQIFKESIEEDLVEYLASPIDGFLGSYPSRIAYDLSEDLRVDLLKRVLDKKVSPDHFWQRVLEIGVPFRRVIEDLPLEEEYLQKACQIAPICIPTVALCYPREVVDRIIREVVIGPKDEIRFLRELPFEECMVILGSVGEERRAELQRRVPEHLFLSQLQKGIIEPLVHSSEFPWRGVARVVHSSHITLPKAPGLRENLAKIIVENVVCGDPMQTFRTIASLSTGFGIEKEVFHCFLREGRIDRETIRWFLFKAYPNIRKVPPEESYCRMPVEFFTFFPESCRDIPEERVTEFFAEKLHQRPRLIREFLRLVPNPRALFIQHFPNYPHSGHLAGEAGVSEEDLKRVIPERFMERLRIENPLDSISTLHPHALEEKWREATLISSHDGDGIVRELMPLDRYEELCRQSPFSLLPGIERARLYPNQLRAFFSAMYLSDGSLEGIRNVVRLSPIRASSIIITLFWGEEGAAVFNRLEHYPIDWELVTRLIEMDGVDIEDSQKARIVYNFVIQALEKSPSHRESLRITEDLSDLLIRYIESNEPAPLRALLYFGVCISPEKRSSRWEIVEEYVKRCEGIIPEIMELQMLLINPPLEDLRRLAEWEIGRGELKEDRFTLSEQRLQTIYSVAFYSNNGAAIERFVIERCSQPVLRAIHSGYAKRVVLDTPRTKRIIVDLENRIHPIDRAVEIPDCPEFRISEEEIARCQSLYDGSRGFAWREGIDSVDQMFGPFCYDQGFHKPQLAETGFLASFEKGREYLRNAFGKQITVEMIDELHAIVTEHFQDGIGEVVFGANAREYRTNSIRSNFLPFTPEQAEKLLRGGIFQPHSHSTIQPCFYFPLSRRSIRDFLQKAISDLYIQLRSAETEDEKIVAIIDFWQALEQLHAYDDGTARLHLLLVNWLFTTIGLTPVIFRNPNHALNLIAADPLTHVKEGMELWKEFRELLR